MLRWASATSLFRALGLSLLYAAFSSQYHEEKQVALTRDRRLAAFSPAVYQKRLRTSISMATTLVALQFAAKTHELLINSSIAMMIMSYIRYEFRVGLGLPFGALIAGHRFSELGYFWSLD
jgi:hypothetical protein